MDDNVIWSDVSLHHIIWYDRQDSTPEKAPLYWFKLPHNDNNDTSLGMTIVCATNEGLYATCRAGPASRILFESVTATGAYCKWIIMYLFVLKFRKEDREERRYEGGGGWEGNGDYNLECKQHVQSKW